MTWTRKAHVKAVPSSCFGTKQASSASWDLMGIRSILFLRYIEKDCIPRSEERHGSEEEDFFQGFFSLLREGFLSLGERT